MDAARQDPSLIMTVIAESTGAFGSLLASVTAVLLVTSIFGAMLSFHGTVARYVFALARERVLPAACWPAPGAAAARTPRSVAPWCSRRWRRVVVTPFVLLGADPVTTMFTWLAALAATAVLLLLVGASAAASPFFHRGGGSREGAWSARIAPTLGIVVGLLVLGTIVSNLATLLGIDPQSRLTWLIPIVLAATVVVRRGVGDRPASSPTRRVPGVGRGRPHPLATPERRLSDVRL